MGAGTSIRSCRIRSGKFPPTTTCTSLTSTLTITTPYSYLELHPSTKVIIADFKSNFLLARMRGEGVPHDVVEKLVIGDSSIGIFPNELRSYDIDSALAVYWKDQSVINMNDNPYREGHVQRILDFIPNRPTIALLGYTGAGPYPQTYHTDKKTLLSKAEDKKQAFFKRYKEMADSIDAKVNIPFAGKYILGGKLSHLNRFRGVADAVEVTQFDPKAVVLEDAGRGSIDCASLQPSAVRTRPYNTEEMESYEVRNSLPRVTTRRHPLPPPTPESPPNCPTTLGM